MNNNTQKPNRKNEFIKLILGIILFRFVVNFFCNRKSILYNLKDFAKEEKQEIIDLKSGKESFGKYFLNSYSIFHEYFIPSPQNDHKPKILRKRSLTIIVIVSTLLKIFVVGYLFFIYPNQAAMTEIVVKKVYELTNRDRVANNLNALNMNSILAASATAKANDMITNNYFAHHSPTGIKPWDWINRSEYPYIFVGENLAMNFTSGDAVHAALMNSPTHKKNILNERYNEIGLAMVSGQIDGKNTNILVEHFGTTGNTISLTSMPAETKETSNTNSAKINSEETSVLGTDEKIEEVKAPITPAKKIEEKKVAVVPVKKTEEIKPAPIVATSMREEKAVTIREEKIIEQDSVPIAKVVEVEQTVSEGELENNLNTKVVYVTPEENRKFGIATTLVKGSQYFYTGLLTLMTIIFLINIFVRFSVQHKPVIFQTLLVILFVFSIASVKVHILESVMAGVAIL